MLNILFSLPCCVFFYANAALYEKTQCGKLCLDHNFTETHVQGALRCNQQQRMIFERNAVVPWVVRCSAICDNDLVFGSDFAQTLTCIGFVISLVLGQGQETRLSHDARDYAAEERVNKSVQVIFSGIYFSNEKLFEESSLIHLEDTSRASQETMDTAANFRFIPHSVKTTQESPHHC